MIEPYHPLPWKVEYESRFSGWHPKASPVVVDANGSTVCEFPQNVNHPGDYDEKAVLAACVIVSCVNLSRGQLQCPECGYTVMDCNTHRDHDACRSIAVNMRGIND